MSYHRASPLFRFSLLLVLSLGAMIVDHRSELLKPVRSVATIINIPFEFVIALPNTLFSVWDSYYPDNILQQRLFDMQQKQAILEARLQRYTALEQENQRLSELLSVSKRFPHDALLTEIVALDLEPFSHRVVINHGAEAGVYLGQPAITAQGYSVRSLRSVIAVAWLH